MNLTSIMAVSERYKYRRLRTRSINFLPAFASVLSFSDQMKYAALLPLFLLLSAVLIDAYGPRGPRALRQQRRFECRGKPCSGPGFPCGPGCFCLRGFCQPRM
ncbi:hypothetical protein V5799_029454 [Amblyomma americanum]|uniref:Uncharacterized protein n=1 Tax=Amblyomma americanum TaxID=6943 RepID=A0AAQ4ERQ8_AMBAM